VVLYADRITGSMERALAETSRRRDKQIAYNEANNITPQSVRSNIHDIVDSVYERDHVTVSIGKGRDGKERVEVGANLAAVIKDMEAQMREAATNLEFEKAARLRDEVKRLKEMELDTLEGSSMTDA
jgi:excinuclease ABC subunit B